MCNIHKDGQKQQGMLNRRYWGRIFEVEVGGEETLKYIGIYSHEPFTCLTGNVKILEVTFLLQTQTQLDYLNK